MPTSISFVDKKEHISFTVDGQSIFVVIQGKPETRLILLYPNKKEGDALVVKYVRDGPQTFHIPDKTMAFMWGVVGPHIYENRKISLDLDASTFLYELPEPFTHKMVRLFDGALDESIYKIYTHKGEKKVKKIN